MCASGVKVQKRFHQAGPGLWIEVRGPNGIRATLNVQTQRPNVWGLEWSLIVGTTPGKPRLAE